MNQQWWGSATQKFAAIAQLKKQGYRPLPLRRVFIPKSNGKMRLLGIPAMRDRAMQALHLLALDPVLETLSDPNSYGFRKNRSTADAMSQIFLQTCRKVSATWVSDADIEGFFDNINHQWLVDNVFMDKLILSKWLNFVAGQCTGIRRKPTVGYATDTGTQPKVEIRCLQRTLSQKMAIRP